jgi:hypothetical protein
VTRLDWKINIENIAESVSEKYGKGAVSFVFSKYGATGFDDLSPYHYDEVFGNLAMMDEDD